MSLPLARSRENEGNAPDSDALQKCFSIATTPEAADYMLAELKTVFKKFKNFKSTDAVLAQAEEYVRNVHLQREGRADPWSGKTDLKTDFQNLQKNLASLAEESLVGQASTRFNMDYAVSQNSELLRAFTANDVPVDEKTSKAMDLLFNSYLSESNLVCKGSILFEADEHGNIKKDPAGNPIKGDVEKIKDQIEHFNEHLAKKGISIATWEQEYPSKQAQSEPKQPVREEPAAAEAPREEGPQVPEQKGGGFSA